MTYKDKAITAIALAAGLGVGSVGPASAGEGYWTNPDGEVYKNANGECWKDPDWTEADATEECDPELVAKPEPPAPKPAPPPPPPEPKIVTQDVTLTGDTLFKFDSSDLTDNGQDEVANVADQANAVTNIKTIRVGGYTDSVGPESYNQKLSERRAQSVADALIDAGIDPALIQTQGYGESNPVATNDTKAGRQRNRRVEISIDATEKKRVSR